MKKLYRSETNKVFAGICGGLGEYFDVDPVIIRLFWLAIVFLTGFFPGVIAYIIAIFVVPTQKEAQLKEVKKTENTHKENA